MSWSPLGRTAGGGRKQSGQARCSTIRPRNLTHFTAVRRDEDLCLLVQRRFEDEAGLRREGDVGVSVYDRQRELWTTRTTGVISSLLKLL